MIRIFLAIALIFFSSPCYANGNQYEMGYYATTGASLTGSSAITTDASNNLLVTNKVGIGTNNPSKVLHVRHSNDNGITTDRTVTTVYSGHTWLNNGVGNERWFIGMIPNSDTFVFRNRSISNGNIIAIEDQSQVNSFYIKANGNIGIGTSNPANALDISLSGGMHIASGVPSSTSMALYNNSGTLTWNGTALATGSSVSGTTNYLSIFTGSSSLGNSGIYQSSGNVGIGTTSPSLPFEVWGNAGDNIVAGATGNIGAGIVLDATVNSGHRYHLYSTTASAGQGAGYFMITDETAPWINRMVITPGGNVGFGTDTPSQKLEVNGQVKIDSFGAATSATVCQSGGVLSSCSSSRRYKENIKAASFGLKEVLAMQPVTFKWKGRNEQDFGLIAEDMERINPIFVTYKDKEIEGVRYAQLTAVLIKAIQELDAKFETYKKAHP